MIKQLEAAAAEARKQVAAGLIQGAVFASNLAPEEVVAIGNQTVHPEERPMTRDSRFDIASVGKVFTASCCSLLVAAGKLDPDAPFTKYLPEHVLGKDCAITVRDLARHVSGFTNAKPYASRDRAVFERELMAVHPVRARLEAFEYSCCNFILLGKIVERVSGMNLESFAFKNIWKPLGMNRTTWTAPGDGPDEVEHHFPTRPAGQHNDDVCFFCGFPIGSGSCFSTASDMLCFATDILERKQFTKEYYDLLTSCSYEKDGARRSFGWDMGAEHRPASLSDRAVFHSGWTGQSICVDPANRFAAIVLTSRTGDWNEAYAGRTRILDAIFTNR